MVNRCVIGSAFVIMSVVSGCSMPPSSTAPPTPGEHTVNQPVTSEVPSGGPVEYRFGQTHEDQITTTVAKMEPFEITSSAMAYPPSSPAWAVEFTFTNNTERAFNAMFLRVGAAVDGRAVQEVMDGTEGFNGLISAPPVAPGQSVTVPVAYSGKGLTHVITVSSLDGSSVVTFTG